jgi:hypothetical protein
MNTVFLMAAILMMAAVLGFGVSKARAGMTGGRPGRLDASRIKTMSREEIVKMLDRIEVSTEPEQVMGAMCYEPMALPDVMEYVCPVCGQKTVYSDETTWMMYEIEASRAVFEQLEEVSRLDLELDETSFCSFCRPGETDHRVELHVTWDDGSTYSARVGTEDLRMLLGFLGGSLSYVTGNDAEIPIRPHLDRIEELLGVDGSEE